jgi:SNF2 family DNA or RNA helicase
VSKTDALAEFADWHIDGSSLVLRLPSGVTIRPTAAEVTGSEYKGRQTVRGEVVPRRPSEALPDVRFARYPAEAIIEVRPPAPDLSRAASCDVRIVSGIRRLDAKLSLDDDQILVGREWFPLATELLQEVAGVLRVAGIGTPGELSLKQYLALRQQNSKFVSVSEEPAMAGSVSRVGVRATGPPQGLKATLYPYQQTGVDWLSRIADEGLGCILGDEMGLGKTVQVIALLLRETKLRHMPSLVIAPATLLENWRREIARFAPSLSISMHSGQERSGFPKTIRTFDVVITSYETAMRDVSILEMIEWNVIVLDEAQSIKTPDAQRTVTLKTLPRRISVAVSGTPVENRLRDLWSLMDFAVPGFLGTLREFEKRYADNVLDAAALEPLVTPLILRRRVADVAGDLPQRIDIPQAVKLSEESALRYDALRTQIAGEYGAAATLVALTKLRMYCTHPFLVDGRASDPLAHSTKYARLLEILDEIFANGEKVLIFTSYTEMADILLDDIKTRYAVGCDVIDGRTPVADRQPTVDRFGQVMTAAALILNPRAAGTGLNITAANHVIHYNLEWNPAVEDQATARAYRRGQVRPVTVHRLFHPGTVEEVIDQRTQRKRAVAAEAVIGTQGQQEDVADIMRALQLSPVLGRPADAH